jgi:hypothetical protein
MPVYSGSGLTYNPSTSTLTSGTFVGNLTGNVTGTVSTATTCTSISLSNTNANSIYYLAMSNTVGASNLLYVDNTTTPLKYNPFFSTLTCSVFAGFDIELTDLISSGISQIDSDRIRFLTTSGRQLFMSSQLIELKNTGTIFSTTTPGQTVYDDGVGNVATISYTKLDVKNSGGDLVRVNPTSVAFSNTGVAINTLTSTSWSGNISTENTSSLSTHYLYFGETSSDAFEKPRKTSNLKCNPFLGTITANIFDGTATIAAGVPLITDNTNGTYYIPFSKTTGLTSNILYVDITSGPLTYNPSSSTLSCTAFSGNLTGNVTGNATTATTSTTTTNVALTLEETFATACYIPFSKTTSATTNALFIDTLSTPLTFVPATGTLSATIFSGSLNGKSTTASNVTVAADATNTSRSILFSTATSGASLPVYADAGITYNPSTNTLTSGSISTTTLTATTLSANMAATNVGINWSVFAMSATGTQNLASTQIYTYCYGAPTSSQTINLPTGTITGQWISITNLGSSGGSMNIFSGGTQVMQLTVASYPNGGNSAMFVYIVALSRWIKAT